MGGVTEWEKRVVLREGFDKATSVKDIDDLRGRLEGVVEECRRVLELDLIDDPNALILINSDLDSAIYEMYFFLATGKKRRSQHGLQRHIINLHDTAQAALKQAN